MALAQSLSGDASAGNARRLHVLLLLLGVSIIGSNAFLLSPVLSNVSRALNAPVSYVAWSVSAYGGATALSGLLLTGFAQRFGYRLTLVGSGFLLSAGVVVSGFSSHWAMLIVAQGFAGLAAGVLLPTLYAMAAVVAPPGKQSATLGVVISGWSLAMVGGIPLSAFISDALSWRYAYLLVGAIGLATTIAFNLLPEGKGTADKTSMVAALRLPLSKPTLLITLCFMISFYGVYTFLGTHIQRQLGLSASFAGFAVLAYGAGFGFGGMAFGKMLDRWGARRVLSPALLAIVGVYLGLTVLSGEFAALMAGSFVWGVANQIGLNSLVSILSGLDTAHRVRLLGMYSAVAYGGAMIAGLTFGTLFGLGGFSALLFTAAGLCAVALIFSLAFVQPRSKWAAR